MTGDAADWAGCLDDLRAVADRLDARLRSGDGSAREVDAALKLYGATMAATLTHLWAEPDHPAFLPSVGYLTMYGSPNPDTLYRHAAVDGRGEYRISGSRGTVPDVSIMPFGPPVAGGCRRFRRSASTTWTSSPTAPSRWC